MMKLDKWLEFYPFRTEELKIVSYGIDFAKPGADHTVQENKMSKELCVGTGGRVSSRHPDIDTIPIEISEALEEMHNPESDSGFQFTEQLYNSRIVPGLPIGMNIRFPSIGMEGLIYSKELDKTVRKSVSDNISKTVIIVRIIRAFRRLSKKLSSNHEKYVSTIKSKFQSTCKVK